MRKYKVKEIVKEISERENSPSTSVYKRFVGLEHYESGNVEIKQSGSVDRLESAMKVFKDGDILIARRNVYLRRAGVVHFSGLTSGDSIVLRPINQEIKDILPFVFNSDSFWDFANRFADGSMSKRLSPKTLMEYEFVLPEGIDLKQLTDLLWAAYDLKESYKKLLVASDEMAKSRFVEMFGDLSYNPKQWRVLSVNQAVSEGIIEKPLDGNHGGKHPKATDYVDSGIPFVMANDLRPDGIIDYDKCSFITEKQALGLDKGFAKNGDVLLTHKGTIGRTAIVKSPYPFIMLTPQVTYYRPKSKLIASFLKAYFDSDCFQSEIKRIASIGSTRAYIGITAQLDLKLVVPPLSLQNEFAVFIEQLDKSKVALQKSITALDDTIKTILHKNFFCEEENNNA